MPGRHWNEEEERKLAEMVVVGCSLNHMAEALGRPVLGIRRKIKRLGLDGGGKGGGGPQTTRSLPSAEILTHEQVLEVLAGALENDLGDEIINIEDVEIDPSKPLVDTLGENLDQSLELLSQVGRAQQTPPKTSNFFHNRA